MVIFSWDEDGILRHFVLEGASVDAEYYSSALTGDLLTLIRPHLRPECVHLQHDNSRPHTAVVREPLQTGADRFSVILLVRKTLLSVITSFFGILKSFL